MAVAAAASSDPIFSISYQDRQTSGEGDRRILAIDIKVDGAVAHYFAIVGEETGKRQLLSFSNNTQDLSKTIKFLKIPGDLANTIELSARVLQQNERTDDTIKSQLPHQQVNLPIDILQRPKFEPRASYHISVTRVGDTLTAVFEKEREPVRKMIYESDPELSPVSAAELQRRYEVVRVKHTELEFTLGFLNYSDRTADFEQALRDYSENIILMDRFHSALARRGVRVPPPVVECVPQ